jgi:hypothetical protein
MSKKRLMSLKRYCCVFTMKKVGLRETDARPGQPLSPLESDSDNRLRGVPRSDLENQGLVLVSLCFDVNHFKGNS